jgi:hypothetical protein
MTHVKISGISREIIDEFTFFKQRLHVIRDDEKMYANVK